MDKKKTLAICSSALFAFVVILWVTFAINGLSKESWAFLFPVGLLGCFAGICIIYHFRRRTVSRKKNLAIGTMVLSIWILIYFTATAFATEQCSIGVMASLVLGIVCFIAVWAIYGLICLIKKISCIAKPEFDRQARKGR